MTSTERKLIQLGWTNDRGQPLSWKYWWTHWKKQEESAPPPPQPYRPRYLYSKDDDD